MLEGKLDDPDAAGSFSGRLLTPEQVATRGRQADRAAPADPGPAPLARAAAAPLRPLPRLALQPAALVMRDAQAQAAPLQEADRQASGQVAPK